MLFERVLSACIKSVSLAVAALVLALGCGQAVTASAGEMTVSAAASLTNAFAALWENSLLPLLKTGLSAAIYTQASDVENEANGLMTYDRKVEKMDKSRLKKLSGQILGQFSHLTNE